MRRIHTVVIVSMLTLLALTGCAPRYPMGMDEKSWNALSPDKKAELRAKQYQLDAALRKERERHRHEERLKELAIEKEREARLNRLYSRAGYKNVVRVNLRGGCVRRYKKCVPFRPISVLLARGETKQIRLVTEDGDDTLWMRYDPSGVTIDDDRNLDDWDAAVYLPEDWERGRHYLLYLRDAWRKNRHILKGVDLYIRYFDDGSLPCREEPFYRR